MPKPGTISPNVAIIPYCKVDGIRTFMDKEIKAFYDRMVKDGIADIVFHDGDVRSSSDFLKKMKIGEVALYVVHSGDDPAGLIWLTNFEARSCRVHFAAFSEYWGKDSVDIGKKAIDRVLCMTDDGGGYIFDVLLGLIPSRNIRAVKWLNKVGLQTVGEIPNALWDSSEQCSISGTLLYLTRQEG